MRNGDLRDKIPDDLPASRYAFLRIAVRAVLFCTIPEIN